MAHETSNPDRLNPFWRGEIHSETTLPLLSYFVNRRRTDLTAVQDFQDVKSHIGKADRPIPDESEQLEETLINLIDNGPGKNPGEKIPGSPTVTIIGGGVSGLCAGYELKKAGFNVTILEASSRVGGRVKTFREPSFAPGLHGEGGAMRIPANHFLLHKYIKEFGLSSQLFDFEMENKFIYVSGYGKTLTYKEFDQLLKAKDPSLLKLFPGLHDTEKGKTCDELFTAAVEPVVNAFWRAYDGFHGTKSSNTESDTEPIDVDSIKRAYKTITDDFDKYSLRSYLTDVAGWSEDAINLYDLGNAHVVFENGFIESFKDAFLSSNKQGAQAGMQQLQGGMDLVPNAFISTERGDDSLIDNIIFGARAVAIDLKPADQPGIPARTPVTVTYEVSKTGDKRAIKSDYLILAIPYTSLRTISKSQAFVPKQEMAIRDVRYVEVTKILLQYKRRWWESVFKKSKQGLDGGLVSDLPIRYTMFPKTKNNQQFDHSRRGVIMAAYTFEQDATILGALSPERRIQIAAQNLDTIFPEAESLNHLEVGASQVFPADELSGGSAFCYFGPMQKTKFLDTMMASDWDDRVFFAGEQASFTHGWIHGAFEAGLRCVQQIWTAASQPQAQ
ncbi:hypothetical protein F5Y19DRAFT_324770 [Xylariaceae sp. FL1651]|nr:hypothetical protein F5Y19DRAFT_324770 [Xylariaceae sp. FL1651]